MKKMFKSMITSSLAAAAILMSNAAFASDRSIEAYGAGGEAVEALSRHFLGQDFFSQDMTEAFFDGDHYAASFTMPTAGKGSYSKPDGSKIGFVLHLENRSEYANDVVISAARDDAQARNFVVRLEPGESLSLDADSLVSYQDLLFVSIQEFSAAVELRRSSASGKKLNLAVLRGLGHQPLTKASNCSSQTPYCTECDRWIKVCVQGTSDCVVALAKRRFHKVSSTNVVFKIDIYWPYSSTKLHSYTSSLLAGSPMCKNTGIHTRRADNSSILHTWWGIDDTLFNGTQSTANCTDGCSQSFTVSIP